MKSLFINLPYPDKIIRRYISSYYSPNFYFPPHELLQLATIVKKWKNDPVFFIDSIADRKKAPDILSEISLSKPDILITYVGHFSLNEDLTTINEIKISFPKIVIIAAGFFPTVFPEKILNNSSIDIIIRGEPELTFSSLYDKIKNNEPLNNITGIAFKKDGKISVNPASERIVSLDQIPFPDLSIIGKNLEIYREPYLGRPFTTMTASRGCAYNCSFCIHTYGQKVYFRSLENIKEELEHNLKYFSVKNIRFLDDMFTFKKKNTLQICRLLEKNNINWTCLSRIDTLDTELAETMKKSGCKRVYLGIESGSQKILNILNKKIDKNILKDKLIQIKKSGLEISSFFITGIPGETEEDLNESITLAKETGLDYILVKKLKLWPGTDIYEKYKDKIQFNLFPFENRFKDPMDEQKSTLNEKKFYREFYLRPSYIIKQAKNLLSHPGELLKGFFTLLKYLFSNKTNKDFI
ncbi:MAG: radical SAM protein [bacterium]